MLYFFLIINLKGEFLICFVYNRNKCKNDKFIDYNRKRLAAENLVFIYAPRVVYVKVTIKVITIEVQKSPSFCCKNPRERDSITLFLFVTSKT